MDAPRRRHEQVRSLFDAALDMGAGERTDFLEHECAGDDALLAEIRTLIRHHQSPAMSIGDRIGDAVSDLTCTPHGQRSSRGAAVGELVGRKVSHYRVDKRLGAGGMGEVYLARDLALGRNVALKVLQAGFAPAVRDRLLREGWASAKLQHPGIATFYEAGRADGIDFIAMEYVAGETLRECVRRGPIPVDEALAIAGALLEALAHAHFYGILHRDIKPANIMLTEEGRPKLLDLGLAKGMLMEAAGEPDGAGVGRTSEADTFEDTLLPLSQREPDEEELTGVANLTRTGAVMGTPGFMAPEQLRGETVDERADLFAVGAVLYEMLAGRPAFSGRTAEERFISILDREPEPVVDISPELNAALARALAKDQTQRYSSASELLQDLRRMGNARTSHAMSLATIDFELVSGEDTLGWLTSALPEAFGASIARIPGMTIIPTAKVAGAVRALGAAKSPAAVEVGLHLGCDLVLSGSLLPDGDQATATAIITEVTTGFRLVEDSHRASVDEILNRADEIAVSLAALFELEVTGSKMPARKAEARECVARGRRLVFSNDRSGLAEGRELLERAIELEPDYAHALSSLAWACALSCHSTRDTALQEAARRYAERSIRADPEWAEGYITLGYTFEVTNEPKACRLYRKALELDPSNYLAAYFSAGPAWPPEDAVALVAAYDGPADVGDPYAWLRHEATARLQRAVELNPTFCYAWLFLGACHVELTHFDQAIWCLERAVETEPTATPPTSGVVGFLGECLRRKGDLEDARARFLEGLDAVESGDHMYRDTSRATFLCGLGKTAIEQGDVDAARAAYAQAVLHLRGRTGTRCGGLLLIQALAGLTRAGDGGYGLNEALELLEHHGEHDFTPTWCASIDYALLEISRAARTVGREALASDMLERARAAGSSEASGM